MGEKTMNNNIINNSIDEFDYSYEENCERYAFYQISKALFTDNRFSKSGIESKVLYG